MRSKPPTPEPNILEIIHHYGSTRIWRRRIKGWKMPCPLCYGDGELTNWDNENIPSSYLVTESCRRCKGSGYIYLPNMNDNQEKPKLEAATSAVARADLLGVGVLVEVKTGASKWMKEHNYWLDEWGDSIDGKRGRIIADYTSYSGNDSHYHVDIDGIDGCGIHPQFLIT